MSSNNNNSLGIAARCESTPRAPRQGNASFLRQNWLARADGRRRLHQGALFTTDWLTEGITATPQWLALDDARITQLWAQSRHLLDELLKRKNPTEADTEQKDSEQLHTGR